MKYTIILYLLFGVGVFSLSAQSYTPQLYLEIDGQEWDGKMPFDLNKNKTLVAKLRRKADDTTIYYAQEYYLRYVFPNGPEGWYGGGTEAHHINMITDGLQILPNTCSIPECTQYHLKMIHTPRVIGIQLEVPKIHATAADTWIRPLEHTEFQSVQIRLKK
jgi:hypothetical protein